MRRYLIAGLLALSMVSQSWAHDWYPPSCCGGHDCKIVKAWYNSDTDTWRFKYVDGKEYDVPKTAIRPDEENKDPFNAHACVIENPEDGVAPYVRCFWRKAGGV